MLASSSVEERLPESLQDARAIDIHGRWGTSLDGLGTSARCNHGTFSLTMRFGTATFPATGVQVLAALLAVLCGSTVRAESCEPARQIGRLDHRVMPEASGMAVSAGFPGRVYFTNDGGNGPYFFVTDMQGKIEQAVRMEGPENVRADYEGMSLGPCLQGKSCLFIGDIGDNRARRAQVELLVFEEVERFPTPARLLRRIVLTYPDGPHDAEGIAVHPNGDVYLLTKGMDYETRRSWPSRLFRLRRRQWEEGKGPQRLTLVGEIDLSRFAKKESGLRALAATGLDIAPDGTRFLVLTYADAFEFAIDLSMPGLDLNRELARNAIRTIALQALEQQESVAYLPGGRSFLYATESKAKPAEVMEVRCLDAPSNGPSIPPATRSP